MALLYETLASEKERHINMRAKKIFSYATIVFAAIVAAFVYAILVWPNSFAPSGVNGICIIIQEVFDINIGYMSFLINIPLAVLVYMKVSKTLAVRSMLYVGIFSGALIVLEKVDLSAIAYSTENGTSTILGPLVAGIVMGCIYSILIRVGAYTGGTDFVSAIIRAKQPQKSVFRISFVINSIVAILSFVVYGYRLEPVFLSIMYSFAATTIADKAIRSGHSATRFVIVTTHGKEIADDIIRVLHHTATIIDSEGAYSEKRTQTLICIVNNGQIQTLSEILKKYPGTFATSDPVREIYGNFKKIDKHGNKSDSIFDDGDGKTT